MNFIYDRLKKISYPGRGIMMGRTPDGKSACLAYFITGRSENSRNRVFSEEGTSLYTRPFDEEKVTDPSLIIYRAVAVYENKLIATNGDQTDTVYQGLKSSVSFSDILKTRTFEPDSPNYTPRISAIFSLDGEDSEFSMNIIKCADGKGEKAERIDFTYPALPGDGRFIRTYEDDGDPLLSFSGEPLRFETENDIGVFSKNLWESLNDENKISLYVRYVNLKTGEWESRLINKNE